LINEQQLFKQYAEQLGLEETIELLEQYYFYDYDCKDPFPTLTTGDLHMQVASAMYQGDMKIDDHEMIKLHNSILYKEEVGMLNTALFSLYFIEHPVTKQDRRGMNKSLTYPANEFRKKVYSVVKGRNIGEKDATNTLINSTDFNHFIRHYVSASGILKMTHLHNSRQIFEHLAKSIGLELLQKQLSEIGLQKTTLSRQKKAFVEEFERQTRLLENVIALQLDTYKSSSQIATYLRQGETDFVDLHMITQKNFKKEIQPYFFVFGRKTNESLMRKIAIAVVTKGINTGVIDEFGRYKKDYFRQVWSKIQINDIFRFRFVFGTMACLDNYVSYFQKIIETQSGVEDNYAKPRDLLGFKSKKMYIVAPLGSTEYISCQFMLLPDFIESELGQSSHLNYKNRTNWQYYDARGKKKEFSNRQMRLIKEIYGAISWKGM
jgi:hypothetical protein